MRVLFFFILSVFQFCFPINPFKIDCTFETPPGIEEYLFIQDQMKMVDLEKIFFQYDVPKILFPGMLNRVGVGKRLKMVDPDNQRLPQECILKIGQGGDRCIVSYASFNRKYAELIQNTASALENVGFNGYFYYRIGGYPNPTGKELQYAGVPYAFKIFMMQEAYLKWNFKNILWMDAALLPLRDPTTLFEWLQQKKFFLNVLTISEEFRKAIPPFTRKYLKSCSGQDYLEKTIGHINMAVFGLKMDEPGVQKFLKRYYQLVELGIPFLSFLPEEYVISSILNHPKYGAEIALPSFPLLVRVRDEKERLIEKQIKKGFYFLSRGH